jgi:hypothetical protein
VLGTSLERPARALMHGGRRLLGGESGPPMRWKPGHFHSTVPSAEDIAAHGERMRSEPPEALGAVDLRVNEQGALLSQFKELYDEAPFPARPNSDWRFSYENDFFSYGDALALYCMLRRVRPKHVIEIGSGWSSCVLLDTCEAFLGWEPRLTLIDPYPARLRGLLRPEDFSRIRLITDQVQRVPIAEFHALESGDIVFIDSTHVARVGSDVNYEIFDLLPSLRSGVFVHFHDIFYPFDYPVQWVEAGYAWNEAYMLRAFLEYNDAFEIVLFNDLLHRRFHDRLERDFPLWIQNPGGSLWLRRR